MSVKIYTNTFAMGQADVDGVSFPEQQIMVVLKRMYFALQNNVRRDGVVATGPAIVKFVIEQEVLVND